jgi:hypothetical protein
VPVELLYSIIAALTGIIGALLLGGAKFVKGQLDSGFARIEIALGAMSSKMDRMDERVRKAESDCATWEAVEALRLETKGLDRRVTVIETTCKAEHGK